MKSPIIGVHHIAIKSKGLEKFNELIAFYNGILGMPIVRSFGDPQSPIAMLDTGSGLLELFADADFEMPSGIFQHIALATHSVDECVEAVRKNGYTITKEPCNMVLGTPEIPYPVRLAFCLGPAGEEVEFFTEL